MKYQKILNKIGLTETESKIYLDLLESGASNIVEISNRTKLNRPLIYKSIPYLIESSLIKEVIKGKRKLLKAESPEYLKNLFEKLSTNFNNIIPELEDIYNTSETRPNIQALVGKKGMKHVFEDVLMSLKRGETYYRYSSRANFSVIYLPKNYKELRDKKQIQRMVITSEKLYATKTKKPEREVVTIPKGFDLFDDNIVKLIYADKIAIIDYNNLTSFIVQNKILADFEKKLFKIMFKFLKGIERGI